MSIPDTMIIARLLFLGLNVYLYQGIPDFKGSVYNTSTNSSLSVNILQYFGLEQVPEVYGI